MRHDGKLKTAESILIIHDKTITGLHAGTVVRREWVGNTSVPAARFILARTICFFVIKLHEKTWLIRRWRSTMNQRTCRRFHHVRSVGVSFYTPANYAGKYYTYCMLMSDAFDFVRSWTHTFIINKLILCRTCYQNPSICVIFLKYNSTLITNVRFLK